MDTFKHWNTQKLPRLSRAVIFFKDRNRSKQCHYYDVIMSAKTLRVTGLCEWNSGKSSVFHYNDIIMGAMASQITSLMMAYSSLYSRRRSKKAAKLRVTGLCKGNSPVTGEFPAQRASNAENVSIWWRHHGEWKKWVITCDDCEQIVLHTVNILRPRQNCRYFADYFFECIFWDGKMNFTLDFTEVCSYGAN